MRRVFAILKALLFWKKQPEISKQKLAFKQLEVCVIPEEEIKKKEKHKQYLQLIESIEKNREQIIKEEKENKLKIIPFENGKDICISLNKKLFVIDKEDYNIFEDEFNLSEYTLSVHYSENGYYLVRINEHTGKEDFLHRFLMQKEIEDYCLENDYEEKEVVVHHKNFYEWNNKRENLQIMSKKEHNKLHHRED